MTQLPKTANGLAAVAAITGCVASTAGRQPGISMRTAPEADALANPRAVASPGGATNRIVEVMSSETSQANNLVIVAVGDRRGLQSKGQDRTGRREVAGRASCGAAGPHRTLNEK